MLKLSPLCLAAVLLLQLPFSAVHAAPVAASVDPAVAARIDAAIAPYYKAGDPGATLIVTRDGKTLLRKAYGMADVAAKVPMREDTSLRLGSITKQFTGTAIMMLVDEGKLAVSDPITKFLPDYPTHGKVITVEHLLTHTSGIVSYTSKPDFRAGMARELTVQQMIDTFKNHPLEFEPGTRFAYNNSGYFLLGAIIEKVSGMPYAKFVEQRIFVPLDMAQTAYEGYERGPTMRAAGHSKTQKGYEPSPALSMSQPYAAGSLVSNVDDLARWDAAIASGKLLKPASWARAFTPYKLADGKLTGYGYGWSVGTLRGSPSVGHGGGINGFSTYAVRLPEQKVYVAVLTNLDGGMVAPTMVANKAAAVAIGKPFPEFKAVAMDAATLDGYTGTFKINDKESRTVRREGDHLVVQRTGRGPYDMKPFAADSFFMEDSVTVFKFGRDAKGKVDKLTLDDDGVESVSVRSGDAAPERKAVVLPGTLLDTYAGRFELRPGFVIELSRDGDKFFGQATGQRKFELMPVSNTAFYVKEVDAEIRFNNGNDQLVLLQNGRELPGARLK